MNYKYFFSIFFNQKVGSYNPCANLTIQISILITLGVKTFLKFFIRKLDNQSMIHM